MSQCPDRKLALLVIGSLSNYVSGTSVSLQILINLLRVRDDIETIVINTATRYNGFFGQVECIARTLWQTLWRARRADVVTFHVNEPPKALPIWLLSRLWAKPFLLRWFGGVDYRSHGGCLRKIAARFLIRHAEVNLMQTKWLVKRAEEDGSRATIWFSTSRMPPEPREEKGRNRPCRRFMFAGQVKPTKGIFEIITAGERFGEDVVVDVYGNLFPGVSEKDFEGLGRVQYRGAIPYEKVVAVMAEHDALLLPSYHFGEGYPGVVIEAYFAGIPVICSNWQSIPEIVDDSSGILIAPRDADRLYEAMNRLTEDDALYQRLRDGAKRKRHMFSAHMWADYFADICKSLARGSLDSLQRIETDRFTLDGVSNDGAERPTCTQG